MDRPVSAHIEIGLGGKSRGHVRRWRGSFHAFARKLKKLRRTDETLAQYLALPVAEQDALKSAPGYWTGGVYTDGRRKREFLESRTVLYLDLDALTPELFADLLANRTALRGTEHAVHTSRKHRPEAPRARFLAPFSRPLLPDEYEPVARILAHKLDPSMDSVDDVSFRPSQIMYRPSCSADSEFRFQFQFGAPIDPDAVLAGFRETGRDPFDLAALPYSKRQGRAEKRARKAEDPLSKPGIVGAFNRAVSLEDAFAGHLFETYEEGEGGRWSFIGGTTRNGIVFHDDGLCTSFHTSDPLAGRTVNAFDAVRITLFGHLDAEAPAGAAMFDRPSFKAMDRLARGLPEVMAELEAAEAEAARKQAEDALGGLDDGPDAGTTMAEPAGAMLSPERRAADALTVGGDAWNGARHADRMRGARLYVAADGQWLRFTGQRWAAQSEAGIDDDAKETTATMMTDAALAVRDDPNPENRRMLGQIMKLHGSLPAQRRMVESARSEPAMHVFSAADFDGSPYDLNCGNGTLDLRTGRLRPARPEDRISKLAGCDFDPKAEAPLFHRFLATIMPDPEMRAFLQRLAGYVSTALVDEEVFAVFHGTGANGKSVFANVLGAALGEYAATFGSALVTRNRNENEAMRMEAALPGRRLALINETAQGDLWDNARIKTLASRERMQARQLYEKPFDFMPSAKLVIRTNHLPGSLDAGDGFWRRCIPIAFTVQVPDAERIPDLDRRIISTELPGVLRWIAEGARDWIRGGLRVPASIRTEAASYREETDLVGEWLAERTIRDPAGRLPVAEAFRDYAGFCRDLGAHSGTAMTFGRTLASRGIKRDPSRTYGRRFIGYRLRQAVVETFDEDCEALL